MVYFLIKRVFSNHILPLTFQPPVGIPAQAFFQERREDVPRVLPTQIHTQTTKFRGESILCLKISARCESGRAFFYERI